MHQAALLSSPPRMRVNKRVFDPLSALEYMRAPQFLGSRHYNDGGWDALVVGRPMPRKELLAFMWRFRKECYMSGIPVWASDYPVSEPDSVEIDHMILPEMPVECWQALGAIGLEVANLQGLSRVVRWNLGAPYHWQFDFDDKSWAKPLPLGPHMLQWLKRNAPIDGSMDAFEGYLDSLYP